MTRLTLSIGYPLSVESPSTPSTKPGASSGKEKRGWINNAERITFAFDNEKDEAYSKL
jgi:hypothetical protein